MTANAITDVSFTTTTKVGREHTTGLCTFWLGGKHYGLDVRLVGEVVALGDVLPVPSAPPQVSGLFSLRGMPVALLHLADVLGFQTASARVAAAIVVRTPHLVFAFGVDRMEAVIPEQSQSMDAGPEDHPAVAGFAILESGVVTVLDPRVLLERVEGFRFSNERRSP